MLEHGHNMTFFWLGGVRQDKSDWTWIPHLFGPHASSVASQEMANSLRSMIFDILGKVTSTPNGPI